MGGQVTQQRESQTQDCIGGFNGPTCRGLSRNFSGQELVMRGLNHKGHSRQGKPHFQKHAVLRVDKVGARGWDGESFVWPGECRMLGKQWKMKLVRSMGPGCEGTCMPC